LAGATTELFGHTTGTGLGTHALFYMISPEGHAQAPLTKVYPLTEQTH